MTVYNKAHCESILLEEVAANPQEKNEGLNRKKKGYTDGVPHDSWDSLQLQKPNCLPQEMIT